MKNQAKSDAVSSFVFGNVPPQALPLEEAVLGALLLDNSAIYNVIDVLTGHSFYKEAHSVIYEAILRLFNRMEPIDLLTVTEEIGKLGKLEAIGGGYYLVELTNRVASAANIEHHSRIIAQKYIGREISRIGTEMIRDAHDETVDVFELLDKSENQLFSLRTGRGRKEFNMAELTRSVFNNLEEASKKQDGITGVVSGIHHLDLVSGGWQPSDFILLAARPSMGKTSLMLLWALSAAMDGIPVQVFSLEMDAVKLQARLLSMLSDVPLMGILRGFVYEIQKDGTSKKRNLYDTEFQRLTQAAGILDKLPLHINDSTFNIMEIRAHCRRMQQKHGIALVLIDYLQLINTTDEVKNRNREQEVSSISRALKLLAKELNVPVIALSQLSRDVEKRGGSKRPGLADLRDSGSLEQDCDMCIFPYRPEYYNIIEDEQGNDLHGVAELIIAKHRNGALETIRTRFDATTTKFYNFDDGGNFPGEKDEPWRPYKHINQESNGIFNVNITGQTRPMPEDDIPF